MSRVKVLIADDSVVYRSQIKSALQSIDWIEVVGTAANGRKAIEKIKQTQVDLLILDLEMPEMNGIETLREISRKNIFCKVLIFSSASFEGANITLEALQLGAVDFVTKPGPAMGGLSVESGLSSIEKLKSLLLPKISNIFLVNQTLSNMNQTFESGVKSPHAKVNLENFEPEVVVIGTSTGGPRILEHIISGLSPSIRVPILIVQHMPPVFTASLAQRLESISGIPTTEARHGERVESNHIYIAPGDFHMSVEGSVEDLRILLDQDSLVNSVRPAVDKLFTSVAPIFGKNALGVILTGMGADGKQGAEAIKEQGGCILIQESSSCVVYGMPKAVKSSGAFDLEVTPDRLIAFLSEKIGGLIPLTKKKVL